ncbi:hydrogenase expression/formation protein HypD [Lebetimonas natsushimae]|uniref:Hydrogenase expression/formation protein HypD n=1 Tax=Lebetimonas natsushimae TaxID=1936991 RepID=A0A292YDU2_9BACT|nr:hydrogenase formation protein HypD [Lebetimonas natsushimae]GAX87546.1 hydrogenase expression/formation protein HypD [Lebetimonas natsushimae]
MSNLTLKDLYTKFRDPATIKALAKEIHKLADKLDEPMRVMEICGGHTHTIMKYGIKQLMPENIEFIHGPGCPVCVMPKERIDHAITLAKQPGVILTTLGDMIRVPGSKSSLAKTRADGYDIRPLHSTFDVLNIAKKNPDKKVIFFAIGFETTTPMTAALMKRAFNEGIKNIYYHINHVLTPPPMRAIMDSGEARINAFIAPSHVSVIIGAKSYQFLVDEYNTPVVVAGFEPVDVMESILMLVKQKLQNYPRVENQYKRAATWDGNVLAQQMTEEFMEIRDTFRWRGLGDIPKSALKLKDKYAQFDAEKIYANVLPNEHIDDHKLCICGKILKGLAKPTDCKVFGTACTPSSPLGSCMVSDEGACNAYYRYAR